jgi:dihydroorotate dehydrogenase electron transfer subunit
MPGTPLHLRGPLGHGFSLDDTVHRLALAVLKDAISRLMPLAAAALAQDMAVTLYADSPLPLLPSALEVYPLSALPEAPAWADQLALDLSLPKLPGLRACLGLNLQEHLPCQAQVLILTPMPCGGLADCGACAVPSRRGWKLACKDGPVFDINDLEW